MWKGDGGAVWGGGVGVAVHDLGLCLTGSAGLKGSYVCVYAGGGGRLGRLCGEGE